MANINNLEMGTTLSNDTRIYVKKSLFGSKVIYTPTQSKVKVFKTECSPQMGAQLKSCSPTMVSNWQSGEQTGKVCGDRLWPFPVAGLFIR
jgi:hypothetical protein